ncbi:MAG: tetratricopeptide repeat protein [Puniceicoccales bacterium]|jgi:tetratricopeptide (TPR) repeat protein|nr:tetratricopeptide repeat protein [Puniceicoccales bacterium]
MYFEGIDFYKSFYESLYAKNKNYTEIIWILARLYSASGDTRKSMKMDRKCVRLDPTNPMAHYNLACSLALAGKKTEAITEIQRAIELGYNDRQWFNDDTDLDSLRNCQRFKDLISGKKMGAPKSCNKQTS